MIWQDCTAIADLERRLAAEILREFLDGEETE